MPQRGRRQRLPQPKRASEQFSHDFYKAVGLTKTVFLRICRLLSFSQPITKQDHYHRFPLGQERNLCSRSAFLLVGCLERFFPSPRTSDFFASNVKYNSRLLWLVLFRGVDIHHFQTLSPLFPNLFLNAGNTFAFYVLRKKIAQNNYKKTKTTIFSYSDDRILTKMRIISGI
jgi:hypothetical protein